MRLLRGIFNWGSAPKPPGFTAFFSPEWNLVDFIQATGCACPPPFRPLNRSLGLLPSIALSCPAQVRSVSTKPPCGSTKKQRTETTPEIPLLTFLLRAGEGFC